MSISWIMACSTWVVAIWTFSPYGYDTVLYHQNRSRWEISGCRRHLKPHFSPSQLFAQVAPDRWGRWSPFGLLSVIRQFFWVDFFHMAWVWVETHAIPQLKALYRFIWHLWTPSPSLCFHAWWKVVSREETCFSTFFRYSTMTWRRLLCTTMVQVIGLSTWMVMFIGSSTVYPNCSEFVPLAKRCSLVVSVHRWNRHFRSIYIKLVYEEGQYMFPATKQMSKIARSSKPPPHFWSAAIAWTRQNPRNLLPRWMGIAKQVGNSAITWLRCRCTCFPRAPWLPKCEPHPEPTQEQT